MMVDNNNTSKVEDTLLCSFFSMSNIPESKFCDLLNQSIAVLVQDYIWHKDEFKVCVSVPGKGLKEYSAHLTSTTCFGDNIEDEWFIVYLILQLTSQYSDLVVLMEDNDGDFLLIEAADYLPSWANPETTENRVFIYQSKVHIIPPEVVPLDTKLLLQDAVNLIVQKAEETKATKEIHEAIFKRINGYPQKIKESHHRALVTLPLDLAALLTLKPSLISHIVTTYSNHDMLDAKCFKNVKLDQCVTIPVLFTKHLYAMLMHAKVVNTNKYLSSKQNSKEIILGLKLALGHEIIRNKSSGDIFNSSEYTNFIDSLTKNGYFKEYIKGSKKYADLLKTAKDYFSNIECPLPSFYCYDISEIMKTDNFKLLRCSLEKEDDFFVDKSQVDTEEWLDINPDELNTFLNTYYGKKLVKNNNSTSLPHLTKELENYLKKSSDFEGIEHDREEQASENQIEFDSDQFMKCIEKMLNIISTDKTDSDNDDSDFTEEDASDMHIVEVMDNELASKLHNVDKNLFKEEDILRNLVQSIKEEGISGPTSNIIKNIEVKHNSEGPENI